MNFYWVLARYMDLLPYAYWETTGVDHNRHGAFVRGVAPNTMIYSALTRHCGAIMARAKNPIIVTLCFKLFD